MSQLTNIVIDNHFKVMQKQETLAQLICRTVLEFEQRQAQELQQQSYVKNVLPETARRLASHPKGNV